MPSPQKAPSFPERARRLEARLRAPLLALALLATAGSAAASDRGRSVTHPRTVAVLETRAPAMNRFLLRGTVPVPPGTFPRADGLNPLAIVDYDGRVLLTQIEVVSRYPNLSDGADVVELLAQVQRDPQVPLGAPTRYAVITNPHQSPNGPGVVEPLHPQVQELLDQPGAIEIAAYDCFGNKYVSRPLNGAGTREVLRDGPIVHETRIYQNMLPVIPVPGGTLPHSFGVHAYLTVTRGSRLVGLDLRFHNAHDGHDATSKFDDPLDKLYFREIEISIPDDWALFQDFEDPFFGAERVANGRRTVDLVGPTQNGAMHVIRWQGQFHRRLMLSTDDSAAREGARERLAGTGRAFCVRGFLGEREYWSWWNEETARYFPQRHQLPILDHVGRTALNAELDGEYAFVVGKLRDGTGTGDYPISAPVLGWGHPYGVDYGGMTSGLEIDCYDGVVLAAAASPRGYGLYTALHRMQTDRQPNAMYQLDGEPSSVEEWRLQNGSIEYVPFEHFVVPLLFGSHPDPFGIRSAPSFQMDYVAANGLQPGYESRHLGFDPHDYQHFVRYTRSAKVLAWLGNDSLAKDDLRLQAEMFNLSYHPHANTASGAFQSSGLGRALRYVELHPQKGTPYGRGEAWGLDCAVAAYALGTPAWRATKLPWLSLHADLVAAGQPPCTGFIQAFISNKAVDGRYQARQQIEQSITENALVGLEKSVLRGHDLGRAAMLRDVLRASLRAFIGEMAWFPGEFGPWRYTGVAPLDPDLPVWCSRADMPDDAWTAGDIEAYQDWSSFAYGYELTGDAVFLQFARQQFGGLPNFQSLLSRLRSEGTDNLGNMAALIALCQKLNEEL